MRWNDRSSTCSTRRVIGELGGVETKEMFFDIKISAPKKVILDQAITVIERYQQMGIKLTLRQLYYQMLPVIENKVSEYQKLSALISDARYAGLIDWDAIEDRIRSPDMPGHWIDMSEFLDSALGAYKLDRWAGQNDYVELLTEKDALHSVLSPIARQWHVSFSVNRGYTSTTAIHDLYERIVEKMKYGRMVHLLYLGDHDPSGLDMIRDINERLSLFLQKDGYRQEHDFRVHHIALTYEQVLKYSPPPNPAKITDPRAKHYIERYGNKSWEVDAIEPKLMRAMVIRAIADRCDVGSMDNIKEKEEIDIKEAKEVLREAGYRLG